ncbi:MAG: ribosome recycling factor [Planctomycetota bacterium]
MPTNDLISECREKMTKAADVFHDELKGVRTGRASTGLVENLRVEYYGTPTPLKQMATIAAPQADMVVIKPFDPSSVKDIEKAIKASDLSIAPIIDGKLIRLNVPPLSEERRIQLVQSAKQMGEQAKVSIRNIRRDANKQLEKEQKDKLITEDDLANGKKQADEITKEYTDKIDTMVQAKSDEIMLE